MKKIAAPNIDSLILTVRGSKVILDSDLAALYHVATKALNQAVKRNRGKFPDDFLLILTADEAEEVRRLRSQFVTLRRAAANTGNTCPMPSRNMGRSWPLTSSTARRPPK